MEYRDEDIEKMFESLPEVPVPNALSQRISERIDMTARRRNRTKVMRRSLGTVAAGVLLLSGSIMFVPSFAAYAKQIPGLEAAVKWLEGAGDFMGIRNAKEHGYIPVQTYRTKWGEREVSVDNLYLEDDRLFLTVTIKGEDIAEAQRSHRIQNELESYVASLPELEEHRYWDGSNNTTSYSIETMEESIQRAQSRVDGVVTSTFDMALSPAYVEQLKRADSNRKITIRLTKVKRNDEYKDIHSESEDIQVPLGIDNIKPTRVVNLDLAVEPKDPTVQQLVLKNITVSPTRMLLDVRTRIEDGGKASLHPGKDWNKIVKENLILKDETGKIYPIRQSGISRDMVNGINRSSWEFVPSVYFENKPKQMTLELKRLYVTQAKVNSTFRIRPDEKFPKKISYQGKEITLLGTTYDSKGILHLQVQPDDAGNNPWASALLTYEPYFLKLQEIDTENTLKHNGISLDTPDTRAISLTGEQLDQQYSNERGFTFSTSLGMIFDNMNRWDESDEKKKVYDMAMMAPKLDEYEISIRRFNAPIEVNQKIEFTIPPLADEHKQVGSLMEPKYSKTVKELEASLLERAKQSIREVAGRDIELFGVEEYEGSSYHDLTVYSKDNKSRVSFDLKQGTSDVSTSMSYDDLPAEIKQAVETETKLNGQQIASRVQEVKRSKTRDEPEVHTVISGKGFEIEMSGHRFKQMGYDIPMAQVNAQTLDTAKQAVLTIMGKPVSLERAGRSYYYNLRDGTSRDVLRFEDNRDDVSVEVGYTSGQLLYVYASEISEVGTDATEGIFSKFTDKQVFVAAAPSVKKLFGIDLDGYAVKRTPKMNYYTFTKEGSPTIEGEMNRHLKFYRFDIARNSTGKTN